MIEKWIDTNACHAIDMIDVSDEKFVEWADGKCVQLDFRNTETDTSDSNARHICNQFEDQNDLKLAKALLDSDIFGDIKEESMKMGYIKLPVPVINIQYLLGKKQNVLPELLHKDTKEIEKIVYYASHVIVRSDIQDLPIGTTLNDKEYKDAVQLYGNKFEVMIGAEAIEALLKHEGVTTELIDHIVLRTIPVVPLCMRYAYIHETRTFVAMSMELAYMNLVWRISRTQRVAELGAPEIIWRNECRMLQETVDALTYNGLHGLPKCNENGIVTDSFQDLYRVITESAIKTNMVIPNVIVGTSIERLEREYKKIDDQYRKVLNQYKDYEELSQEDAAVCNKLEEEMIQTWRPLAKAIIYANFLGNIHDHELCETLTERALLAIKKYRPTAPCEKFPFAEYFGAMMYSHMKNYIDVHLKYVE